MSATQTKGDGAVSLSEPHLTEHPQVRESNSFRSTKHPTVSYDVVGCFFFYLMRKHCILSIGKADCISSAVKMYVITPSGVYTIILMIYTTTYTATHG